MNRPTGRPGAPRETSPAAPLFSLLISQTPAPLEQKRLRQDLEFFARYLSTSVEGIEGLLFAKDMTKEGAEKLVLGYRNHMAAEQLAFSTINRRMWPIRKMSKFACEAGSVAWELDVGSKPESARWRRDVAIRALIEETKVLSKALHRIKLEWYQPSLYANGVIMIGGRTFALCRKTTTAMNEWVEARGLPAGPLFTSIGPDDKAETSKPISEDDAAEAAAG